jgi:hypothetical protein
MKIYNNRSHYLYLTTCVWLVVGTSILYFLYFFILLVVYGKGNILMYVTYMCMLYAVWIFILWSLEGVNCLNSTTRTFFRTTTIETTIVATAVIVSGNRFFSEWKEKMDFGRCVRGSQSIRRTIPTCHIPINFGLITFQLNQCILITVYSTMVTLCDHTID